MASAQISHDNAPSGLILLHKPPGITSFDALRDIKRMLGTGKVGHTGTLDKFAEGLLLTLAGRALKLSRWFTHLDKQYEGVICFGAETDTLDPEGAVIAEAPLPSREAVESALTRFCGAIEQAPPAYSAIHIDGERASALARRGEIPEMQKRQVTIYRMELLSWEPPLAKIFVHCSSGTYIRSLARDIALAAGSRAHLVGLIRTKVGGFGLEEREKRKGKRGKGKEKSEQRTKNREQRTENKEPIAHCSLLTAHSSLLIPHSSFPFLLPINKTIFEKLNIPCMDISPEDAKKAANGKPLGQILGNAPLMDGNTVALFSGFTFIAMIENLNGWRYGCVYARD